MTVFKNQRHFMVACDQSVESYNDTQYDMYISLIAEEHDELKQAIADNDRVEQLDALIDILVVTIGAIHSAGFDGQGAWDEVMRSNLSKIDPLTGKVTKRADGKVLKPVTYSPPDLTSFLEN
jgi:predicted HAD superfamily Cof-like phosphohydrolase